MEATLNYFHILLHDGRSYVNFTRKYINQSYDHLEPFEIILYTLLGPLLVAVLWAILAFLKEQTWRLPTCKHIIFNWVPYIPFAGRYAVKAKKQLDNVTSEVAKKVNKGIGNLVLQQTLPKERINLKSILEKADLYLKQGEYSWNEGYVSGAVYHGNDRELNDLVRDIFEKTAYHNPLHPDVFPGIRLMESEVVRIICNLYNGGKDACGTITSGGTESIFLACKAYRNRALHLKGIKNPVMVIPVTAHAAFDKAAHILNIKVKHIPIDPRTTKVDLTAMKKAIDGNTCMLVGSTPAFPHGAIDPIEEIAKLGLKYDIPVHMDSCLGGFLIPFMEEAGFPIPPSDFSIEGVTSISADTHKYAYAPKGTSVVMYSNKSYRHYQYFVQPNWPGGIYGTPSLSGSRSGGIIATCWASLLYHGRDYYVEATKKVISVTRFIEEKLREIPGIHIIGKPEVSVIAIGSDHFDIYRLSTALTKKGWNLNILQFPSGFHFCVTLQHTKEVAARFVKDVQECTAKILKEPSKKTEGDAAIYGTAQRIPDRSIVSELVWTFLDACASSEKQNEM